MNRKSLFLIALIALLSLFVLSACGTSKATPAVTQDASAAVTEEHNDGDEHAQVDTGDEHNDGDEHAEAPTGDEHNDGDEHGADADEHEHAEIPDEFAAMTNPVAGDAAAIEAGQAIYSANCASCHGENGGGDGPAAAALDPKPTAFSDADIMATMTDSYLYWRISEGGIAPPFNSQMPPWKDVLSEEQIWQVITYLRTLSQ